VVRVRPRYESWIAQLLGVGAITLYPWVLFSMSKERAMRWRVVAHECVHVRQVRNIGWWKFYLSYIGEWARHILDGKSREDAYLGISYEQEAFDREGEITLTESERAEFGV
jgi:hypothetical protein